MLPLQLIAELPWGSERDEQQQPDGCWRVDLGGEHRAPAARRPGCEVHVQLPQLAQWPAAGQRQARAVRCPVGLIADVVAGAQQAHDLVVAVDLDRFLERDQSEPQAAQTLDQDRPPACPHPLPTPKAECGNANGTWAGPPTFTLDFVAHSDLRQRCRRRIPVRRGTARDVETSPGSGSLAPSGGGTGRRFALAGGAPLGEGGRVYCRSPAVGKASVIHEDATVLATMDVEPVTTGHVLAGRRPPATGGRPLAAAPKATDGQSPRPGASPAEHRRDSGPRAWR
jgi:hypothetical protein